MRWYGTRTVESAKCKNLKIERFEAAGLRCIEVAPDGSDSKTNLPLIITMHGLGDRGESYIDFAPVLSQFNYRFVFPTAPVALPGGGFQWFPFAPYNFFNGVTTARQHVTKLVNALSEHFQTPAERIVLSGFSQGAMMTLDAGLRYRGKDGKRLAGLVALSGMLVVESPVMPNFMGGDFSSYYANARSDVNQILKEAATDQLPVLVIHGTHDPVVPISAERESVALLKKAGLPVEYVELNYGHEISMETLMLVQKFLTKVL